ncbi:glycosyltransferase [Mycobacterium sp.]|uniref:glycosyltransferase n=1 Tax=Mycobacterium sp. TaxID=1785 RepID=UPI0025FD5ED7|nr:glycosyltransferase [Mycobacterium sp.]
MTSVRHMAVVVPARDEQDHIEACLFSITAAIAELRHRHPGVTCDATVVLDCCTDQTGPLARAHGARTVRSCAGRVGAARHAGAIDAITRAREAGIPADAVWLANTDADTIVPGSWLTTQWQFANTGADAVIGTVTPDRLNRHANRLWRQRHRLVEGHDHIHGANLGLRASTYQTVGGFAAVSLHEDLDLVDRIKAGGYRWEATHQTTVTTSARTASRVEGGFASYIAELGPKDSSCA